METKAPVETKPRNDGAGERRPPRGDPRPGGDGGPARAAGRERPGPGAAHASAISPSLRSAQVRVISRDTCICEMPTMSAIWVWVRSPKKRR